MQTHPATRDPLAALRTEIRGAAAETRRIFMVLTTGLSTGLPLPAGVWAWWLLDDKARYPWAGIGVATASASAALVGVLTASLGTYLYRRTQISRLQRLLDVVPAGLRRNLLVPLANPGSSAAEIAAPLLAALGGPTELTPSLPPAARGSEVAPPK